MYNSSSYRTKRRRIKNELLALESSDDDDDDDLSRQNVINTFVLNSIEPSKISHNNSQQQPSIEIPSREENISEVIRLTQSTLNSIENTNSKLQVDVNESLRKWATDFNIPQNAINGLLKVLKYDAGLSFLPKDARTLLQCKSTKITNLRNVEPGGYYYHFGLSTGIIKYSSILSLPDIIKIAVGVDGLPLSKSSSSQFWPILAYIAPYHEHVFPIGIYHGHQKPQSSDDYLKEFVSEAVFLTNNGIYINNIKKNVVIEVMCCDAPAKAFLMKVKGHSGFFSCTRCTIEGEYQQSRVCFPYLENGSTIRTHDDYVLMKYEEHHTSITTSSICSILNVDIVQLFSMDYMHLVCLGVMRKLINLWMGNTKGPMNIRIPSWKINKINSALNNIKINSITKDFSRKPRFLLEISRWKATEFRQFLLYTGMVVLKNVLTDDCYKNFLILSISMRILLSPNHKKFVDYAQKLLDYFVKTFEQLYGSHLASHNIHGLLHLTEDYKRYGPLDNCSTFPFENYMKNLKRMLRKHDKPLQQVVKRYEEQCPSNTNDNNITKNKLYLTSKKPDCYVLTKEGDVVQIDSIIKSNENNLEAITGRIYLIKDDLFKTPLQSSKIDIFLVKNLSENAREWKISDIKNKLLFFESENHKYITMSILHN